MAKSKFVRGIECQVCHRIGSLQILSSNYYRIRHYTKLLNNKPQFEYHRNDRDYVERILANTKTDRPQNTDLSIGDQKLNESVSLSQNECGRSLAWSRTSACHADDPGSNLGDRTKRSLSVEKPSCT